MSSRKLALAALLAAATQLAPLSTAHAQADDAVTVQARARFKEGVDFFDKGKFEEARLAFLQAYALKKHPAVLLNLAQSSARSGHPLEASKYFQQYLREATTATPAQRKDAESGLVEVRQKLGRIEVVAPAGTEITLDDKEKLGATPYNEPIDVDPGAHTLKSSSETVRVTANAGQRVEAKFGSSSSSAAPVVAPLPAASSTPASSSAPPSDSGIVSDGAPPGADKPTTKRTNLLAPPETIWPVYAGLGVSATGFVTAIVFAIFKGDAQSKADTVANTIRTEAQSRSLSPQGVCNSPDAAVQRDFGSACATLRDNNSKVDTNATIANVGLGVGIAGLVFAGGWYLLAPKKEEAKPAATTGLAITPYGGFGTAGLGISSAF